jgi:cardiolipin synthase A/B
MPPARHGLDAPTYGGPSRPEALSLRAALSRLWPHGHAGSPDPKTRDAALLRRHARLLMRALRRPLVGGNRLELLIDGPATYAAMFAAIDAARDNINLESYIVEADGPGAELAQRLLAKCSQGVKVNLLFDGFGSIQTKAAYFDALRAGGVQLCEYNPLRSWRRIFSRAVHRRDHRKLLVVDGRIAFVGGINISGVYAAGSAGLPPTESEADAAPPWRDTHLRIEGPLAAEFQRLFLQHWSRHADAALQPAHYLPLPASCGRVRGAAASFEAGQRRNPFYRALLKAIDHAQQRVSITVAYFVPTRRLVRSLSRAAQRGVDVQLVLPSESDAWAPLHAGRSHYGRLLQAGVRIFERQGALLHAKTTVIDGVWATVGSANLDWRSFVHNAEANAVVLDPAFGAEMESVFRTDVAASREVTLDEWRRRGWFQRVRERLARRFEFLL